MIKSKHFLPVNSKDPDKTADVKADLGKVGKMPASVSIFHAGGIYR